MNPAPAPDSQPLLTGLPDAWIHQLISCLASGDRHSLMGACTQLRDAVLRHPPQTITYEPYLDDLRTSHNGLLRALQAGARDIHLWFRGALKVFPEPPEVESAGTDEEESSQAEHGSNHQPGNGAVVYQNMVNQNACAMMLGVAATRGGDLHAITQVTLQYLGLNCLLPPYLAHTCPAIRALTLDDCVLADISNLPGPSYPALRDLTLNLYANPILCTQQQQWACTRHGFRELECHLQQLPALDTLTIGGKDPETRAACLWQCTLQAVPRPSAARITSLVLYTTDANQWLENPFFDVPAKVSDFVTLTRLHLPMTAVEDPGMQLLLNLEHLTDLLVNGFYLATSFADRQCNWQLLRVSRLYLADLHRVPLDGIHALLPWADPPVERLAGMQVKVGYSLDADGEPTTVPTSPGYTAAVTQLMCRVRHGLSQLSLMAGEPPQSPAADPEEDPCQAAVTLRFDLDDLLDSQHAAFVQHLVQEACQAPGSPADEASSRAKGSTSSPAGNTSPGLCLTLEGVCITQELVDGLRQLQPACKLQVLEFNDTCEFENPDVEGELGTGVKHLATKVIIWRGMRALEIQASM